MNSFRDKMFQTTLNRIWACVLLVVIAFSGCRTSKEFSGFAYDPPNVTDTSTKELDVQPKRVMGAGNPRLWVSNEFSGARINDFLSLPDSTFEIIIKPELAPINNSPWYAFAIWSDEPHVARLRISYENGEHRYIPKVSKDKANWRAVPESDYLIDKDCGCIDMNLIVSQDTTYVSAQELRNLETYKKWRSSFNEMDHVKVDTIGYSNEGRPLLQMMIDETNKDSAKAIVIVSRQHPPEISGYLTSLHFIETILSDSPTAQAFRKEYKILTIPVANPDGVENGHWRYNGGGVDLNRDWQNFNQPETQIIRDRIAEFVAEGNDIIYGIDFHSTDENLFYPILPSIEKKKGDVSTPWTNEIISMHDNVLIRVEPFDLSSPIFKNWLFRNYGADAITYEVSDELDRKVLPEVAIDAANSLMKILLNR